MGMAAPVTKSAVSVTDPRMIRFELERAFYLATSGRPGPTLVEIPIDVQGAMIDEHDLPPFEPAARGRDRPDRGRAAWRGSHRGGAEEV